MGTLVFLVASGVGGCSSSETPACQPPPTPELLQAVPGQGRQVSVSWAPVEASKVNHYGVYWRQGNSPQSLLLTVEAPDTGRVVPRLDAGTYVFAVETVDSGGCTSPRSAEVSATVTAAPQSAIPIGTDGSPSGFYEYLPAAYGDGTPRPLLVFLHGSGLAGNGSFDLDKLLLGPPDLPSGAGPTGMVNGGRWPQALPFVVLAPQSSVALNSSLEGCEVSADVTSFVTWALSHYTVDPKRVYLTGSSCGAIRVWSYLAEHADDQVAAVWLLAGNPGTAWSQAGCNLGKVAIWAMHGTADTTIDIGLERAVMQPLLACPSPPRKEVIWTEVPDAGHEVAWESYEGDAGMDALNWLLTKSKP
jgi:poly(3-hydroxybutyrate) depolymerase